MSAIDTISEKYAGSIIGRYKYEYCGTGSGWKVFRPELQSWDYDRAKSIRHDFRLWCRDNEVEFSPNLCDSVMRTIQFDPRLTEDVILTSVVQVHKARQEAAADAGLPIQRTFTRG